MPTLTEEKTEREVVIGNDARPAKVRSANPADFVVPTGREEEWRFTPLRRLRGLHDDLEGNGGWGVDFGSASGVDVTISHALPAASRFVPSDRIAARALANLQNAVVITIAAEAELAEPLHVSIDTAGVAFGHVLVRAEHHSKAAVVVEYTGSAVAAINTEVVVGESAQLTYTEVHSQDAAAVHAGESRLFVGRDASLRHIVVTLGGNVVRLLPTVEYDGPGATAELYGAMLAGPGQHHEARTYIDHATAHCISDVAYKAVLHGEGAHTVWVGDVFVRSTATDIDTYELNRNLLLDRGPRADSVPNLELETGEVQRAGHASVTGQLDANQLFYLQARGIPAAEARKLVVRGFFNDIVDRIGDATVVDRIGAAVEDALNSAGDIA